MKDFLKRNMLIMTEWDHQQIGSMAFDTVKRKIDQY